MNDMWHLGAEAQSSAGICTLRMRNKQLGIWDEWSLSKQVAPAMARGAMDHCRPPPQDETCAKSGLALKIQSSWVPVAHAWNPSC
jgi:hypothetical protein